MTPVAQRRIAIVTPFFGRDAQSPPERFVYEFAAQLALRGMALDVLTTCARSTADDWSANYYRAGRDVSEAFPIERFRVESRDRPAYSAALLALASSDRTARADEALVNEGIRSPGLLSHVRGVADRYDAFIFAPYAAATTLAALPFVAERAIVLPQLDDEPPRHSSVVRERLLVARAFLLRDTQERDDVVTLLGSSVAPRCVLLGPLDGGPSSWDAAHATVDTLVGGLAALDDGRSRERALAQVAYLYPVVRRQRSIIIAMQQSRFWQIRNAWFGLRKRLRIPGDDVVPQLDPNTAAAELSVVGDPYFLWRERHALRDADVERLRTVARVLPVRPHVTVAIDAREAQPAALAATIQSVRNQIWPHRSIVVVGARGSAIAPADDLRSVDRYADVPLDADFAGGLSAGDLLEPDTFVACALALNADPSLAAFYADEDEIDERGTQRFPYMKPDWSPETALSRDYVGRPCLLRAGVLQAAGGLRDSFGTARWYDALLRVSESGGSIVHEPRVLAHCIPRGRVAGDDLRRAIESALERRAAPAVVEPMPAAQLPAFAIRYRRTSEAHVAIIIPTRDRADLLEACLQSIATRSTYAAYEIVIIDNGSREARTADVLRAWQHRSHPRVTVLRDDAPFNYSRLNNRAVATTDAEYLLFLNNDTVVISEDWIEALLEQAQRADIGAVGALLLYPDDTVQHAGVLLGILGLAGHAHRFFRADAPGYFGALQAPTNYSAVTAACMMVGREKFVAAGGFDESLAVAFNDVDLCLRLRARGQRSVYLPYVRLYHFESKSRGGDDTPAKVRRAMAEIAAIRRRWPEVSRQDPAYNPNLTVDAEDFSLRL